MTTKANSTIDAVQAVLGVGGNVELVPIFIPVDTYKTLLQLGKERGLSVANVIARSIELFLQPKPDINIDRPGNGSEKVQEQRKVTFKRPRKQ